MPRARFLRERLASLSNFKPRLAAPLGMRTTTLDLLSSSPNDLRVLACLQHQAGMACAA